MWSGYSEQGTGSEERGPATFAIQQPEAVRAAAAGPQATAVRGGVQGTSPGLTAQAPGLGQVQDRTMSALFKMGEEVIGKRLNAIRDEQFLRGVQEVASGKALADIANDQPWYTKIFGDTPLVEGARAYEVSTKAAQWSSTIEQSMPELRKQSPDSVPKFILGSVDKLMTGDTQADLLLRGEVLKRMPSLIERHTKEHYKYNQERISKSATEFVLASGAAFQATMANPDPATSSPESRTAAGDTAFQAFMPAPGENEASYEKRIARSTELLAERGDFHVLGLLRERGLFSNMAPDDRVRVERAINAFGDYHRTHSPEAAPFLVEAALLHEKAQNSAVTGQAYSGEQYLKDVQEVNRRYRERTGNPLDLISAPQQAQGVATAAQAVYNAQREAIERSRRALEKATTAEEKAAAKQADINMLSSAALRGELGTILSLHDAKKPVADEAFFVSFQNLKAPEGMPAQEAQAYTHNRHARLVIDNANDGYINPFVKNLYTAPLRSLPDDPTAGFDKAYVQWRTLNDHKDSQAARIGYFGADLDARLTAYDTLMKGDPSGALVNYRLAMKSETRRKELTKDEKAHVTAAIKQDIGWLGKNRLGGDLTAQGQAVVMQHMQDAAELYKATAPELGTQEIARRSLNVALANGLEVYGGYAWRAPSNEAKPLRNVLNMPETEIHAVFKEVVAERLAGAAPTSMTLLRQADVDGRANFTGFYTTSDGAASAFTFTSDDVKKIYQDPGKRATALMRERDRRTAFKQSPAGVDETKPAILFPSIR